MQTVTLNTEEAPNKFWAYRDASMRNAVNSSLYATKTRVQAERMKLACELVYSAKEVYIAFGKRGISIKVDGARVRDRKELALLEQEWAQQGVTKKVSAQGVLYRFVA